MSQFVGPLRPLSVCCARVCCEGKGLSAGHVAKRRGSYIQRLTSRQGDRMWEIVETAFRARSSFLLLQPHHSASVRFVVLTRRRAPDERIHIYVVHIFRRCCRTACDPFRSRGTKMEPGITRRIAATENRQTAQSQGAPGTAKGTAARSLGRAIGPRKYFAE